MRRQYFSATIISRPVKVGLLKSVNGLLTKVLLGVCFVAYAYSFLSISPLIAGNVAGVTKVLLEKQLLAPLAVVATLLVFNKKNWKVSVFLAFTLLFIFSAYFVYIYSNFIESTDFVSTWQRPVAEIGYVLNKFMFYINFSGMLATLAYVGFIEITK